MTEEEAVPSYEDAGGIEPSTGGDGWHAELPRVDFKGLLGQNLVFIEIDVRASDFKGADGQDKQYALARCTCPDGELKGTLEDESVTLDAGDEFTCSTGRVRIVEQLRKAALPVKGTPTKGSQSKKGFDIWELVPWS
ncbi:hypothetical protein LCGC14_1625390 [marine sediment metagenome]|uniref:Uncharacterized protein n=1 Tax=marine sediment metagenome TaxID=412755 RepID=A0A0F9I487_9ZZZZ